MDGSYINYLSVAFYKGRKRMAVAGVESTNYYLYNTQSAKVKAAEKDSFAKAMEEAETEKVIEVSVASLSNGISFYFNDDTGEVSCINDADPRPGRQALWSKVLSKEDLEKCDKLFENYRDNGHWRFRFQAYLKHEDFWDMYLDGKVDLAALRNENKTLSEDALYDKLLQDIRNADEGIRTTRNN